MKENIEKYRRLSFFVKKEKIKEALDVQIFVCGFRLHNNILNLDYVFLPLLSNFYKSKSSETLSEHRHS